MDNDIVEKIKDNFYDPSEELISLIYSKIETAEMLISFIPEIKKNILNLREIEKSLKVTQEMLIMLKSSKNRKTSLQGVNTYLEQLDNFKKGKSLLTEYREIFEKLNKKNIITKSNIYYILKANIYEIIYDGYGNSHNLDIEGIAGNIIMDVFNLERKLMNDNRYMGCKIYFENNEYLLINPFSAKSNIFKYKF